MISRQTWNTLNILRDFKRVYDRVLAFRIKKLSKLINDSLPPIAFRCCQNTSSPPACLKGISSRVYAEKSNSKIPRKLEIAIWLRKCLEHSEKSIKIALPSTLITSSIHEVVKRKQIFLISCEMIKTSPGLWECLRGIAEWQEDLFCFRRWNDFAQFPGDFFRFGFPSPADSPSRVIAARNNKPIKCRTIDESRKVQL